MEISDLMGTAGFERWTSRLETGDITSITQTLEFIGTIFISYSHISLVILRTEFVAKWFVYDIKMD